MFRQTKGHVPASEKRPLRTWCSWSPCERSHAGPRGGRSPAPAPAPARPGARTRAAHRSCGLVDRFCGISRQRVDRLRMAVAAMCAASMSCV